MSEPDRHPAALSATWLPPAKLTPCSGCGWPNRTTRWRFAEVHVRCWQRPYRGLFPDEYLDGLQPEERAGRYTFDGQADQPLTIVAGERRAIRGFARIGAPSADARENIGELLALDVAPDHWGRGIGRGLMLEARKRMIKRGFGDAVLWVLAGNHRAERFYRADGWTPDGGRRQDEVSGVLAAELRDRRPLQ